MSEEARSMLLAPAGLYLPLAAAAVLALVRRPRADTHERERLFWVFLIGIAVQFLHFFEEYSTALYALFPPLFGLAPVPARFFVGFNVFWLGIWVVSAFGIRSGVRAAYFPVWFFGIAMCLNGVVHPLLAVWTGGYFPGLLTSPLAGIAGILVMSKLIRSTEPAIG